MNVDIDIYAKENADGSAVEYSGTSATKQALYMWLTSRRGDFILNPGTGGMFDSVLFKSMRNKTYNELEFALMNGFVNNFSPEAELLKITIEPDYENRITSIAITYRDVAEDTIDSVTIYTNAEYTTKDYDYITVDYTGENLRNFCMIKQSDMTSERLIFDPDTNIWTWGEFLFPNFSALSENFTDILLICNGS